MVHPAPGEEKLTRSKGADWYDCAFYFFYRSGTADTNFSMKGFYGGLSAERGGEIDRRDWWAEPTSYRTGGWEEESVDHSSISDSTMKFTVKYKLANADNPQKIDLTKHATIDYYVRFGIWETWE